MWELLQKLEDLGWKPYGKSIAELTETEKNVRLLTSLSSGLWQFVCENGMIKKEGNSEWIIIYPNERTGDYQKCHSYCKGQSEYWILESSLKDESELEDFLLSNIKTEGIS